MAFLLTAIDKRAMRLNGRMTLAGVAVSSRKGELLPGIYKGCRSGASVEIVIAGGRVHPEESARDAYKASMPTPVAIDAGALQVPEIKGEVFLREGDAAVLYEAVTYEAGFPESYFGHWIPVTVSKEDLCVGDGWVMQVGSEAKVQLLLRSQFDGTGSLEVSPQYAPEFKFVIR
jgi:hypothetical protein